jgi:hypothetical protein
MNTELELGSDDCHPQYYASPDCRKEENQKWNVSLNLDNDYFKLRDFFGQFAWRFQWQP